MYLPSGLAALCFALFAQAYVVKLQQHADPIEDRRSLSGLAERATILAGPTCQGGATLSSHDCNVALLGLGGGIQGTIEFLRVDTTTNSSSSGGCTMTVTATNGGTAIDISKGRLEQGQKAAIAACGQQAWTVTVQGGAVGGDLIIQQSAATN